jgi:hypothetical protein
MSSHNAMQGKTDAFSNPRHMIIAAILALRFTRSSKHAEQTETLPAASMNLTRMWEWYSSAVNGTGDGNGRGQQMAARGRRQTVALACVALYLAAVAGLLARVLQRDDGVFTYTLDDPYIHLALAQSLAHGHYGINMGEASSPSSSILWPFLLAPFAGRPWGLYLPLGLNMLCCGAAAWWIGRIVQGWDGWDGWDGWVRGRAAWVGRLAVAAALMLVANLPGLTFVGMEHGLQVLLAIACAAGVAEAYAGRPIPGWCVAAAALGPMVRYENFALTGAVACGGAACGCESGGAGTVLAISCLAGIASAADFRDGEVECVFAQLGNGDGRDPEHVLGRERGDDA